MQSITLNVEGMSCGHCVKSVEGAMQELGATAKVDLAAKTVTVNYDESKLTVDAIKEAIDDQGYEIV